jgi:hypothetical protein
MRDLRIDYPGDGAWIMHQIGGVAFDPDVDHSIATYDTDTGDLLGGFVTNGFTGVSLQVHMAGKNARWFSRDLIWCLFNYIFNKLECKRAFATISEGNPKAIALDMRAGWRYEAKIKGVYADGDMVILAMDRATCPWLRLGHGKQKHTKRIA